MSPVRERLAQAEAWYNERPVRERALILVTVGVLVFVLAWELLMSPVEARHQQLSNQMQALSATRDSLLGEQETLSNQLANDPSAELRERLAARQSRLDSLDRQITETTGRLIAPRDMVALLREILAAQNELELVSLELKQPVPVYDRSEEVKSSELKPEPLLYAHDVELKIRGGYLGVMNYLERLEAMDERIGWLQLDYDAGDWPHGDATITVRTLSLEAAWLGV